MKKELLKNVSQLITRGKAPDYNEFGMGKVVKSAQVQMNRIMWEKCPRVSDSFAEKFSTKYSLFEGDILLNGTGTGTLGRPGIVKNKPDGIFIPDSHINLIRLDPQVANSQFVFYWLTSPRCQGTIELTATGSTNQIELSAERVSSLEIPLPELAIQQAIVARLDQADALRQKDRQLLALYDELAQSVFVDMFGDPVQNEKGWMVKPLVELADIVSGVTKNAKSVNDTCIEVPYMRVANVQDGRLDLREVKTISVSKSDLQRYTLRKGDILLTEGGDPDKLGRGCVWNEEIKTCIHQNHIFRVRLRSNHVPLYLSTLIGTAYGKKYFLKAAKQTTGIATINLNQLKAFPAYTPPLPLQQRFAAVIAQIEGQKALVQQQIAQSEALFQRLLQDSFGH